MALVKGESRRKNIAQVLTAIDDQVRPGPEAQEIRGRQSQQRLHRQPTGGDARGRHPRHSGLPGTALQRPRIVAESSAGDTLHGFEEFGYNRLATERRSQKVQLIDLNREAKYKAIPLIDYDLHAVSTRLAARLFDPDAYVICAAMFKTHNVMVATLSIKNMAIGAPLHSVPGEKPWNDKRKTHNGLRQTHYNIFLTQQIMKPFLGAAVIDGYEGMEGNGPSSGTPVPSRLAIASTDYVAADRVGVETMGINPDWMGYLRYCAEFGVGQYDLAKIDIRGEKIEAVRRKYLLHRDIERELQWMGPMLELPTRLGEPWRTTRPSQPK